MKKILSLLLVMLFIFAMGGGVYAENGDVTFTGLAGGQNIYIEPIDGQASLTVPETLDHTSNDNAITMISTGKNGRTLTLIIRKTSLYLLIFT